MTWKEYFEDLYNLDTQEQVPVHMCVIYGFRRGNYFGGEPIRRTEVEVRLGKLKNGNAGGKDEVTGEMMKGGSNKVVDWLWRLCNMAFESGVVPEDWRSAMIVPLYKGKGEITECSNYRSISLLSVIGKIYAGILLNRVSKVTETLSDDEQGVSEWGEGVVNQILTLKQIGEKDREKKCRVYGDNMNFEKAYDRVNREEL